MLPELLDFERAQGVTLAVLDQLVGQVDLDLAARDGLGVHAFERGGVLHGDGQHAVLEGVVEEDVGEGRGDDALDAEVVERPGGVLARGAAAEVGARADDDLGGAVRVAVKHERGVLGAIGVVAHLVEEGRSQAGALDGLEELLGDDGVRVDVLLLHGRGDALEGKELGEAGGGGLGEGGIDLGRRVQGLVGELVLLGVILLDALVGVGPRAVTGDGGGLGDDGGLDVGGGLVLGQLADVGELTDDGGGGGHDGGHQVGAALGTLTTLEVAVAGGGATLLGGEDVGVHAEAHGATSLAPLETGLLEDLVETLGLGLVLDETGAGDDEGAFDVGGNLLALDDLGGSAEILDTGVGAGADEDLVNLNVLHLGAGDETHVLDHATASGLLALGSEGLGVGNNASDGDDILRRGTPGDGGDDILAVDEDIDIVLGVGVGGERLPVGDGLVPLVGSVLGGKGPALEVLEGDLIGSDHTGSGTGLDGHIADGHAGLYAEAADDGAAELDDGTSTAGSTDLTDNMEDDILGANTGRELTVNLNPHVLAALGDKALGGEDVLDLGGTDTEGEGAESAMGGSVGVTANDSGAGKGEALLGADDVHDTLPLVAEAKVCDAELLDVLLEGDALRPRIILLDEAADIL